MLTPPHLQGSYGIKCEGISSCVAIIVIVIGTLFCIYQWGCKKAWSHSLITGFLDILFPFPLKERNTKFPFWRVFPFWPQLFESTYYSIRYSCRSGMSFEGDVLIGSGSHLPSASVAFSEGHLVQVPHTEWLKQINMPEMYTLWNLSITFETSREGNGTPLQYSCLENPMDGGAW